MKASFSSAYSAFVSFSSGIVQHGVPFDKNSSVVWSHKVAKSIVVTVPCGGGPGLQFYANHLVLTSYRTDVLDVALAVAR